MKTHRRVCSCKHRGCACQFLLSWTRGCMGLTRGLQESPDTILKNLCWQHSSCISQGIFVSSCYKVIFTLTEEIPPRLFCASLI